MELKRLIYIYDRFRTGIIEVTRKILFGGLGRGMNEGRILIVRKGTIGDHTVCQPIYLALRRAFPDAQIDLLTSNGGLAYAHIEKLPEGSLFDQCYNFNDYSKKKLTQIIRRNKYDAVIELPQDLDTIYTQIRNMLFYRFCGISKGLGWAPGMSRLFKTYRFKHLSLPREWEKQRDNLRKQGLDFEVKESYIPCASVELPEMIDKVDFSEIIAIAPGAKFKSKQWPYFQELITELQRGHQNLVLIGGELDANQMQSTNCINLCGKLDVLQSRLVLSKVKVLICNDSGPMHLAYSVDTPVLALFGGRSYPKAWWPPFQQSNMVMFRQANFPVAYIGNTYLDHTQDGHLAQLSVEEVLQGLDQLLRIHKN